MVVIAPDFQFKVRSHRGLVGRRGSIDRTTSVRFTATVTTSPARIALMTAVQTARIFALIAFAAVLACPALAESVRAGRGTAVIDRLVRNCYVVNGATGAIVSGPGMIDVELNVGDTIIVQDTAQTVNDSSGLFVFGPFTKVTLMEDTSSVITYSLCYGKADAYEYDNTPIRVAAGHRRSRHELAGRRKRRVTVKSSNSISPTSGLHPQNGYAHNYSVTASESLLTDVTVHCGIGNVAVTHGGTIKRMDPTTPDYSYRLPQEACPTFGTMAVPDGAKHAGSWPHIDEMPSGSSVRDASGSVVHRGGEQNVSLNEADTIIVGAGTVTIVDDTGYFVFGPNTTVSFTYDTAEEICYDLQVGTAESVEYDAPVVGNPGGNTAGRRRRRVNVRASNSISPSSRLSSQEDTSVADRYRVKANVGNVIKVQVNCLAGSMVVTNVNSTTLTAGQSTSYTLAKGPTSGRSK